MKYIYLSYSLDEDSPVYKGLKKPSIDHKSTISEDGYNTYLLCVENHSGTHVDAPGHFLEDGKSISDYDLENLVFNKVLILEIPQTTGNEIGLPDFINILENHETLNSKDENKYKWESVDFILIITGFFKYRQKNLEKYLTENPGINPEVINFLRENFPSIRGIGIDSVSISCFSNPDNATKAHKTAFIKKDNYGEPLLLVEDMDLSSLSSKDYIKQLFLIPWQVKGIDSAPCTVMVQLN
ncbi:MAG: cyclase family protein [Methanobacteriaceae archaeon]|nr:cyclase family protein [Methanobacteriaceae archaeon]